MELKTLEENGACYVRLYADCIPVSGASRAAIYDLTRNELILFPIEHVEVLEYLLSDKIGTLLEGLQDEEERKYFLEFIQFLDQNEVIALQEDPSLFPVIEEAWDAPCTIQNAIIDVDKVQHNFGKLFAELTELACPFVQIRSFSTILTIEDIYKLLKAAKDTSIQGIELILKYNDLIPESVYTELIRTQALISCLTIHSSPEDKKIIIPFGERDLAYSIDKGFEYISQCIDSQAHCGIITLDQLNAPTVNNFYETKLYNGCLNRKIAVDATGHIKNCPSMSVSYGDAATTSLVEAHRHSGFKHAWGIKKDQIEICKDCEFRYACSDCRAYLEKPQDIYSKPLKCGYNPYTCEWEEWSNNPLKQKIMKQYEIFCQQTETISVNS